jgi:hypothetical protein
MVLSRSICASVPVAEVRFTGQEGATHEERVPLEGECG